ncbi:MULTISPECIES: hypothetical protein [unclassified Agromyces]|uniref:hypothetical protein n=1 Tax=unclassified Agromyces TaxID=2639701 RepID=UPI003015640E
MNRTTRIGPAPVATLVAGAIALAGLLAGCAPGDPDPTASPSAPPTTTAPVETTAPPPESAPPTESPSAGGTDRPIEAIDAYSLCRAQTSGYYGDPGRTVFAPFEEATVLLRDDGDWYVYMEVDDPSREPALVESAGSECIVGGTVAEPVWQLFGTIAREYADESIADYNRPPAQD